MAIEYSSPLFSFMDVPTETENCAWSEHPCLPVYSLGDLAFQVIAQVTGADKETFDGSLIFGGFTLDCDVLSLIPANYTGEWTKTVTGEGDEADTWIGNYGYVSESGFPDLDSGQCFSIALWMETGFGHEVLYCFSQCFTKITDECYTTKFIYRCNENAFDFDYTAPDFSNRVRLKCYLHSATNPEEEKSYSKSDGSSVKLMHRIWKEYKVKCDYLPDHQIEKFTVMTAHDSVLVICNYSGVSDYFIRMEKVEPAWMEEQSPGINVAQSMTTLRMASPRASINSNCQS